MLIFKSYVSYITLMICLLLKSEAAEYSRGEFFQLIRQNEISVSVKLSLAETDPRRCFHHCGILFKCRYVLSDVQNGYCELVNSSSVDGIILAAGSQLWKKLGKIRFCKINIALYDLIDSSVSMYTFKAIR